MDDNTPKPIKQENLATKAEAKSPKTTEKVVQNPAKIESNNNTAASSSKTPQINIKNAEKKGSPSFGFIENLKKKWQSHVEKNKLAAEKRKTSQNKEKSNNNDKVITKPEKLTTKDEIALEQLFENFDPRYDKKKLTKPVRRRIIEAEKLYQAGTSSIKDLIAPSSVEVNSHNMKLNGMFVKSFFVFNYPRFLEANWLNPIINFDATMDISIFTYPTKSDQMLKILRKKVAEMLYK